MVEKQPLPDQSPGFKEQGTKAHSLSSPLTADLLTGTVCLPNSAGSQRAREESLGNVFHREGTLGVQCKTEQGEDSSGGERRSKLCSFL